MTHGADRLRVGLLVVGHVDPRAQHIAGDYPELFGTLLGPHHIDVVPYALEHGEVPRSLRECDGWICSPSRASTYDELAWIAAAEALHLDILDAGVPYVGICFGHQLLAQALGARVERSAGGWGVGVQEYAVVEDASWMDPPRSHLALIASHQDQVVEVPREARVIASADYCPIAGLAVGERAWTIQAHPEFVPALAEHLLRLRTEIIGPARVGEAAASLAAPTDGSVIASWIARFLREGRAPR